MTSVEISVKLNVCGLEPPEPMVRVLEALSLLNTEQRLCILIDREPHPLYRVLSNDGYQHRTTLRPDYLYEILVWKNSHAAQPDV